MIRILLVNDERLFVELEQSFLRREECEVLTASTANEAIERTREHRPDLVLLDVALPGTDGREVCRMIRSDPSLAGTPVILITTGHDERSALEAGADGTLQRPITRHKVLAALRRHLAVPERSAERRFVRLPVTCSDGEREYRVHSRDLSFTGMFLALAEPAAVGEHLALSFSLPRGEDGGAIETGAEVVRRVAGEADSDRLPGLGVRFVDLGAAEKARINRFVRSPHQRLRAEEGP